ncbi:MAG: GAF domain-containing protein [Calditrichaeota bacterium]|nr:MAG: GAF domain-containing protein [Calditrichota bacterium]MBL1203873.1 GAF domain-containing protein [Calditrichota bacterium]NOG43705.1 SpoIIE family protein phosphatase [Calditrichota bacterium]
MPDQLNYEKLKADHDRLKTGIQELAILNEIATTISSTMELDNIIEIVVKKCIRHFKVEQANISLITEDTALVPLQTMIREFDSESGRIPFRLDQQITGWMLTKHQALIINDVDEDPRFKSFLTESAYFSLLAVPMMHKGKVIGVLSLFNKSGKEDFDSNDQRLLTIIASGSSQVIVNARLLEEEKKLIAVKEELNIASKIQKKLLPDTLPEIKGYQIAGTNIPAKEVGGDYYDVIPIDENRYIICLGDVSGKGMPAALLVANLQATIHSLILANEEPSKIVQQANKLIHASTTSDKFITFFLGILDLQTNELIYCNAGHDKPFVLSIQNNYEELGMGGLCLGFVPHFDYERDTYKIKSNEILVIFSDGVTEAMNAAEEEFELDRLQQIVLENNKKSAEQIMNTILKEIENHVAGEEQMDDITLVVLKKTP